MPGFPRPRTVAPRALLSMDRWVDRASTDIPLRYVVTAAVLGDALGEKGDTAKSARLAPAAQQLANAARLNEVLGRPKRVE